MVADPLRIVITGNVPFDNESERLATLLSSGWSYVHLRYPELTLRDVRHIIEGIPPDIPLAAQTARAFRARKRIQPRWSAPEPSLPRTTDGILRRALSVMSFGGGCCSRSCLKEIRLRYP